MKVLISILFLMIAFSCLIFCNEKTDEAFVNFLYACEEGELTGEIASETVDLINEELPAIKDSREKSQDYYRLVVLFDSLITDASSWMKYSSLKDFALEQSLALDPEALAPRIYLVRQLLFGNPQTVGNREEGESQLSRLKDSYPDEPDVLALLGDYFLSNKNLAEAKSCYEKVLEINPESRSVTKKLEDITAVMNRLSIGSIRIIDREQIRTRGALKIISSLVGEEYTLDFQEKIEEALAFFPGVSGISVAIDDFDSHEVYLSVYLREKRTKAFGLMADSYVYAASDDNPVFKIFPTAFYSDQNLGGSGWEFTGAFSGVYLKLSFLYPEHKGIPLDLGFSIDGLAYPNETLFYDDGKAADWSIETSSVNTSLFATKEIFPGLNVTNIQNFNFFDYSGTGNNLVLPSEHIKYTGKLNLSFFPGGKSSLSLLSPTVGLFFEAEPQVIYRFVRENWGPADELYVHDGNPCYKAHYLLGYGVKISDKIDVKAQYAYLHGINLYELDKWNVGQTSLLDPFPRLSGYHGYSFRTDNSSLLNFDFLLEFLGGRGGLVLNHDLFYFGEKGKLYQGSGLGIVYHLADSLELSLFNRYAWNRENREVSRDNVGLYIKYLTLR